MKRFTTAPHTPCWCELQNALIEWLEADGLPPQATNIGRTIHLKTQAIRTFREFSPTALVTDHSGRLRF